MEKHFKECVKKNHEIPWVEEERRIRKKGSMQREWKIQARILELDYSKYVCIIFVLSFSMWMSFLFMPCPHWNVIFSFNNAFKVLVLFAQCLIFCGACLYSVNCICHLIHSFVEVCIITCKEGSASAFHLSIGKILNKNVSIKCHFCFLEQQWNT